MLHDPDAFGGVLQADCLRGDLVMDNNGAQRLVAAAPTDTPRMLIPTLAEAHCHLDKCYSLARIGSVGGDLATAIEAQMKDKSYWTAQDLRQRMTRGLAELTASGCTLVRSHIDWGEKTAPPLAWSILAEVAQDTSDILVQSAALTGIDQLADRSFCFDVAKHIAAQHGGVLGAFVLHHKQIETGLAHVFAAAEHYGLMLDFHVDEGLGEWNGLEAICDVALKTGHAGPILCGHAVSLIDRDSDDLKRILDKLSQTNISICALPTTNLYLQGRRPATPDRRGLTRLRELHEAGVPIIVASDNVADAFCPMGQHDPRAALHLAALAAHLDPPMGDWLPAITHNPARALGVDPVFVDTASPTQIRVCAATTTADLVAGRAPLSPLET